MQLKCSQRIFQILDQTDPFAAQFGLGGVNRRDNYSKTPLHLAAEYQFVVSCISHSLLIIFYLFCFIKKRSKKKIIFTQSVLFFNLLLIHCFHGKEVAEVLLKYGADVNAKLNVSKNQTTPLMIAAAQGNLRMVRLLVQHGAVVEQRGEQS